MSLILKLQNWNDQRSWDEFYRTYHRLIYSVAIQSGLTEHEAWDVVQETVFSIAKQSRENIYNPAQGSFKAWLLSITRWRIKDQFRRRRRDNANIQATLEGESREFLHKLPSEQGETFERLWDREWRAHLTKAALARVRLKVSPLQFQIFDYHVIQGMSVEEVRRKLGVTASQVYLAKHRIGARLKDEIAELHRLENE